ncbi:phosphatase PAP2 family protein [Saccharothrix sp. HUAS TT1]|uniref:phosphatase PAP2 family protein n=1 Tax=unclassified Saccharothrix TaxID=2593673 RepID=UPI00345C5D33
MARRADPRDAELMVDDAGSRSGTTTVPERRLVEGDVPPLADRFALRAALALVLTAAAGVGFAVLALAVRLRWAPLHDLDHAVADGLTRLVSGNKVLSNGLHGVTALGGTPALVWLAAIGAGWLLVRRQLWVAVYVVVTAVGAGVLGVVVKDLVARLRPVVEQPVSSAPGPSFPSGHALGSMVTYGVLVLVFLPVVRQSARWVLVGVAGLLVAVIGVTRVALGVHFLTDVLAGWLLGALWLVLTAAVFRRWRDEVGARKVPLTEGVAPEAAADLRPAPGAGKPLAHPWRGAAELLVGWGLLVGVLYGVGRLVVGARGDRPAPAWDAAVVRWLAEHRSPTFDTLLVPLGELGNTGWVIASAAVVGPLALAFRRSWAPVLFLVLTLLGEITLFLTTTAVTPRARPDVPHAHELPPTSSFPSGHVAASLALCLATALLVCTATSHWWRWLVVAAAVVVPALVAVQRLYTGAHYPTDVLGSLLLSGTWTALVWWVVRPDRQVPLALGRRGGQPAVE